jgi:hypothetical protein
MESMNDTLMGKHTAHHLQQVERELYELLETEKEQIIEFTNSFYDECVMEGGSLNQSVEQYYNETFNPNK